MHQSQGKRHGKLGATLITVSTLLPYLLIALEIMISEGAFIMIGGLGTVGLVMVFAAIIKYHYRARWIFFFLAVYALLLLLNPPVGTAVAIVAYVYLGKNWRSFFTKKNQS